MIYLVTFQVLVKYLQMISIYKFELTRDRLRSFGRSVGRMFVQLFVRSFVRSFVCYWRIFHAVWLYSLWISVMYEVMYLPHFSRRVMVA